MYRVEITINKETLNAALGDLKLLDRPPTIVTNWQDTQKFKGKTGFFSEEWGHYLPAKHHIALQTLPHTFVRLPLFQLVPLVRETLLHELRHAHQYTHWDESRRARMHEGGYWKCDCEVDARKWSWEAHLKPEYRSLVTVERIPQGKPVKLP